MKKNFSRSTLLLVTIFIVLLGRLVLITTRYLDPDEFAHLHWSFLLFKGYIPYKDFFINFTPVYFWLFSIMYILPQGSYLLIVARLIQFALYLGVVWTIYTISKKIKNHESGLLAALIFLVFPITFDKTLEIRHDMLMTFFYFLAFFILMKSPPIISLKKSFLTGLLLSLSALVLSKIVFFLPSVLIYYCSFRRFGKVIAASMIGFFIPFILFTMYLGITNTTFLSWENIVHGSLVLKKGEGSFSVIKTLSPYPFVYSGSSGISFSWIVSSGLWIITLLGIGFLFKNQKRFALASCLFFLGACISILIFPTPYSQYFIPPTALASIIASITIISFLSFAKERAHIPKVLLIFIICLTLGFSFFTQATERYGPHVSMDEQKSVITSIITMSKPDETFYDMVGSYVLRPHGYYICCNIYSGFAPFLHIPLPSLSESLIAKKTKYIVLDRAGKSLWLPYPQDLAFLVSNYLPSDYPKIYTAGSQFYCSLGECTQMDLSSHPLNKTHMVTILFSDTYIVSISPQTEHIMLNDVLYQNNQQVSLETGKYSFSVPKTVQNFRIQLSR